MCAHLDLQCCPRGLCTYAHHPLVGDLGTAKPGEHRTSQHGAPFYKAPEMLAVETLGAYDVKVDVFRCAVPRRRLLACAHFCLLAVWVSCSRSW